MKMHALWAIALLALTPALLQAQEPQKDSLGPRQKAAPTMKVVRLTDRDVDRATKQLNAELTGTIPMDDATQAMTRTEYTNIKNALMVARLDFRDGARLESSAPDKTLEVRRMNAEYYRTHEGTLEALLSRLAPDKSCTLCR